MKSKLLDRDTQILRGELSLKDRADITKLWNKAIKKGFLRLDFIRVSKSK